MSEDYLSRPLSLDSSPPLEEPSTSRLRRPASSTFGAPVSPYLNYDPRFLQQAQPEFIFPEGARKQRGRFELAFSEIGTSVMIGAGVGGLAGFYNGMRATSTRQQAGKLWRTQMVNHVMKQGSGTANTVGTLAVMYSAIGVILQYARGEDDNLNTMVAGTSTGFLYKATAGLKKCALGGGIGFGVSALYCLFQMVRANHSSSNMKFL